MSESPLYSPDVLSRARVLAEQEGRTEIIEDDLLRAQEELEGVETSQDQEWDTAPGAVPKILPADEANMVERLVTEGLPGPKATKYPDGTAQPGRP